MLEKRAIEAIEQTGIEADLTKVEDIIEIMKFNVMSTPALVVNGNVEIRGRVPSVDEIIAVIKRY